MEKLNNPLVTPVYKDYDEEFEKLVTFFNETLGFCPNSVITMYHRPRIAHAFIEMNKAVMENKGRVTSAQKRLIAFISSNITGCRYCEAHTIRAAQRYGAAVEQLENIWEYKTHDSFSEAERAALDFAAASSMVPNGVTKEIAENLKKHWDDGEIVEILGVISLFGYLNRWNDTMATELEDNAIVSGVEFLSKKGWNTGKHKSS